MLSRTFADSIAHAQETANICQPLQHFVQRLAEEKRQKRNHEPVNPSVPCNASQSSICQMPKKMAVKRHSLSPSSKKSQITVSPSIQHLAQRKREAKIKPTPVMSPLTHPSVTAVPRHTLYHHKRIVAVLAIGTHGFTLSNAIKSVTEDFGACKIVTEVVAMKVRLLYCFDEDTFEKWTLQQKNSDNLPKKLSVRKLNPFPRIRCIYCKQNGCHKWNANSGIAHLLKIPFDPIFHAEKPEPGYHVVMHKKIAAVLCIATNGFTLCNGVESVIQNGRVSNSSMAQKVLQMKVRVLNCFDEKTFKKWRDVQESYAKEFENLKVVKTKPIQMTSCEYCKKKTCHKWRACVGMSFCYKLIFDPVEH